MFHLLYFSNQAGLSLFPRTCLALGPHRRRARWILTRLREKLPRRVRPAWTAASLRAPKGTKKAMTYVKSHKISQTESTSKRRLSFHLPDTKSFGPLRTHIAPGLDLCVHLNLLDLLNLRRFVFSFLQSSNRAWQRAAMFVPAPS